MKCIKPGAHRLIDKDPETSRVVSEMLRQLERGGMDAVRKYSEQFDGWKPKSFELDAAEISRIVNELPEAVRKDTDFCQRNVRRFAQAQLTTLLPLETEIRPGVILGHRHIPIGKVGSYIPGG